MKSSPAKYYEELEMYKKQARAKTLAKHAAKKGTGTKAAYEFVTRPSHASKTVATEAATKGTKTLSSLATNKKKATRLATKTSKKIAKKTIGKTILKGASRILSGPVGWGLAIGEAGYSLYKGKTNKPPKIKKGKINQPFNF